MVKRCTSQSFPGLKKD